jgi:hypothetical protein
MYITLWHVCYFLIYKTHSQGEIGCLSARPRQVQPQPVSVLMTEPMAMTATSRPPKPCSHQYLGELRNACAASVRKLYWRRIAIK